MGKDQIDREYSRLMEYMEAKEQGEAVLKAIEVLFEAENLQGVERRIAVAEALVKIICLMPASRDAVHDAHPDLENAYQIAGAVHVAIGLLFGVK